MAAASPYIAVTDTGWYQYLSSRAEDGRLDEANFWSPRSVRPIKHFSPGTPVFFRRKHPLNCIAGYGFFAHFTTLSLGMAWETFGWKNGAPDELAFLETIGGFRGEDLLDPHHALERIGCTILRDLRFWPGEKRLPWGPEMGWAKSIQQGKTERDPRRAELLLNAIRDDYLRPEIGAEYAEAFELLDADERRLAEAKHVVREGQGSFRARLLDAYGRRCAITGERTEPVLEAAHIQPYLGRRSNHVQNGLVLTREFHTLFDEGLVTVTPDYEVRISPLLRERWKNGHRYYGYDRRPLTARPERREEQPSRAALEWHLETRFLAG